MQIQAHPGRDQRDQLGINIEAINQAKLYAMYSVFSFGGALESAVDAEAIEAAITETGVTIRGFYDLAGFRADADLMVWLTADDPTKLQAAYHALRNDQELGLFLDPVWSVVATHRPAEFNRQHVPSCFAGFAPRPWLCVYPFVRSYQWYNLPEEQRSQMLREHGMAAREFPDVIASTLSSFALGDYEWILAFEADDLHRLVDVMRAQRAVEARTHVREETPFYTGPRVELAEWLSRQPSSDLAQGCCDIQELGCSPDCECGCQEVFECECGAECCPDGCGPDCKCGCQTPIACGDPGCDCGCFKAQAECDCGEDCLCGCQAKQQ